MWTGDDLDRPLSKAGWKQAHALGKRLAKKGVGELVSSPYVRCMQTLEPLARAIGAAVRPTTVCSRIRRSRACSTSSAKSATGRCSAATVT